MLHGRVVTLLANTRELLNLSVSGRRIKNKGRNRLGVVLVLRLKKIDPNYLALAAKLGVLPFITLPSNLTLHSTAADCIDRAAPFSNPIHLSDDFRFHAVRQRLHEIRAT